jgi:DNA-binding response OmpR family regulator
MKQYRRWWLSLRRLLLIDQHSALARRLEVSLLFEEVEVMHVASSDEAIANYGQSKWDIVVIGDILNSTNIISLLLKLRGIDSEVPIITIIHSVLPKDRIRMFYLGANDVISRPYHIDELIVRIMNLLGKGTSHPSSVNSVQVSDLFIDTDNHFVFREEKEIQLTATEYELLLFLCVEAGKVQSREIILNKVWGYEFHGDTNIVDVYIRYLRIKIDKGYKNKLIKTVRGIGYMIAN